MIQSDALSRRPDWMIDNDENDNITVIPEDLFIRIINQELAKQINDATSNDVTAQNIITLLADEGNPLTKTITNWEMIGTQLFKDRKQYVPDNINLQRELVKMFHDSTLGGHPGQLETFNKVVEFYWWPGQRTFIKNYVNGCSDCQQFKI